MMGTGITKGLLSTDKIIICDLIRQWFFSHSCFGNLDYVSRRGLQTLPPHSEIHKLQINIPELRDHSIKATQNWWQLSEGEKHTAYISRQNFMWILAPPAWGKGISLTQAASVSSVASARKLGAPLPWMKLRFYCLFWGNENKTQVPLSKRRGNVGFKGAIKVFTVVLSALRTDHWQRLVQGEAGEIKMIPNTWSEPTSPLKGPQLWLSRTRDVKPCGLFFTQNKAHANVIDLSVIFQALTRKTLSLSRSNLSL